MLYHLSIHKNVKNTLKDILLLSCKNHYNLGNSKPISTMFSVLICVNFVCDKIYAAIENL